MAEGYDLSDPLSKIAKWDGDNVVLDIDVTSGENNRREKWIVDKDDTPFNGEEWFYSAALNDSVPMLREFFWQAGHKNPDNPDESIYFVPVQNDVREKLTELGFAKHPEAA